MKDGVIVLAPTQNVGMTASVTSALACRSEEVAVSFGSETPDDWSTATSILQPPVPAIQMQGKAPLIGL